MLTRTTTYENNLDVIDDNSSSIASKEEDNKINCEKCQQREVDIFNVLGNYCVYCWDEVCHPVVTFRKVPEAA